MADDLRQAVPELDAGALRPRQAQAEGAPGLHNGLTQLGGLQGKVRDVGQYPGVRIAKAMDIHGLLVTMKGCCACKFLNSIVKSLKNSWSIGLKLWT